MFGEIYRSGLNARTISSTKKAGDSLTVVFGTSTPLQRISEFNYFSESTGEARVIQTEQEDVGVVLEDVDFTKLVQYRTFCVPNDNSIDEFASDWVEYNVEIIDEIVNSLSYQLIIGGLELELTNPTNLDISVVVSYMVNGVEKISNFNSNSSVDSKKIIGLEAGLQDITIVVSDLSQNGVSKTFSLDIQEAVSLDKSAWSIIEASLTRPDYPVENVIDGNGATFWHTPSGESNSPTGVVPDYPHYFIVDLGAEKTVASYKLFRRENNSSGANAHEIWVSTDNVTYTKVATYDDSIPNNNGVVLASDAQLVRYVKYIATSGPNLYTNLGEIEVYGLE